MRVLREPLLDFERESAILQEQIADQVADIEDDIAALGDPQISIQFRNEGVNLGTPGSANVIDFVGAGVDAVRVSNTITITISGGGSGVDTANSPNANEYARFTDADTIEGRTEAELKADLNLEIGTDVQAWDTMLDSISGLSDPNADRIGFWDDSAGNWEWLQLGSNLSITGTTLNATGGGGGIDTANSPNAGEWAKFTDADTIEGRTNSELKSDLDLEIGIDLQAYSANLDEYAAVNPTVQGLALLDDVDAAAQRTTIGLGNVDNTSDATKNAASVTLTNKTINFSSNTVSGTKAEFDTALSDGNFAYQSDLSGYQPVDSDLTAIAGLTASNDDFLQRKSGNWSNRTVAQVKTDLGLSGTNSGDQTSIVGIGGTKTQFDTAVSDGNFVYQSDIGSAVQAWSANLDEYAAVNPTTAGLALLDDADNTAQRTTLGLGTLATQNGTFSGTSSGTNTGDQTSIVGFSNTKAQFNTVLSDGDFLFSGDITQYTDELAQDAIGAMIDSTLEYVDATPLLRRAALSGHIVANAGSNSTTIQNGVVTEAMQNLNDNTTNDVTTLKHGYVPKAPGDTSQFLRADGSWAAPTATAGDLDKPETGALTVATGKYHFTAVRHSATGSQRITVAGTARLRITN
jgi:hypothetical protein